MIKVFVATRFSSERDLHLLSFDFLKKVASPHEANLILVPQFVRSLKPAVKTYLESVRALGESEGKPVVLFKGGDLAYRFRIPGFIVFSSSLYRDWNLGEYASPAPIEDLSQRAWTARTKRTKPVVSFCGYSGLTSWATYGKYLLKNLFLVFAPQYRRGVYWRRKAMRILACDSRFVTNFIVRNKFSGKSGAEGSSGERQEYIENIMSADFVLCPKGDGNYSARFYETLALGRIPVLIDTEVVLPLEKEIGYEKIIVRVPFSDVAHVGDYIARWYGELSEEEWEQRQKLAQATFQKYLRYEAFCEIALESIKKSGPTL